MVRYNDGSCNPRRGLPWAVISMINKLRGLTGKVKELFVRLLIFSAQTIPENREAIWSVPTPLKTAYFVVAILLWLSVLIDIAAENSAAATGNHWQRIVGTVVRESATEFAPAGIGIAIAALVIVQGGFLIMSLYHAIVNRFVLPVIAEHKATGRAEGQAEARAANNQEWRDWLQRRDDAEAKGEPFDEPPPGDEV